MQKLHLKSAVLVRTAASLAALVALAAPAAARAASVYATHSTIKVRPATPVGNATSIHISAARNEFEAFQVVVTGDSSGATGIKASASALTGPGGAIIPAERITLYREALYQATNASGPDGAVGMWPDALVPDVDTYVHEKRNAFPFNVPANESRAIWVEVFVPTDATPGDYTGTVTVTGSGLTGGSVAVPVTLTVHRFTLPSTPSLHTAFGLWWAGPCQAHFGSFAACGGDAGVEQMRSLYIRSALDHRISIENAVYAGPTNNDWTHFDQVYGPLLDGTAATRLSGAKLTSMRYQAQRSVTLASQWAQHFKKKGWFDRLFDYTCDEPPLTCAWSDIPTRAAIMKQADPDFRTLVTTNISKAQSNGVTGDLGIIVPLVNEIEDKNTAPTRTQYSSFISTGHELWWYQSCMSHGCGGAFGAAAGTATNVDPYFGGWPTYAIDAAAIRHRAQEWLSFKDQIGTELYYETGLHLDSAWTNQYDFGANGDGTLFYPGKPDVIGGTQHIPVESIRLKLIREGIEDYEYLKILSDLGEGNWAMQQVQALFPVAGAVGSVDPEKMYAVREAIAAHIDAHLPAGSTTGTSGGGTTGATGTTGTSGGPTTDLPAPATPICTNGQCTSVVHGCSSGGGSPAWLALMVAMVWFIRPRRS